MTDTDSAMKTEPEAPAKAGTERSAEADEEQLLYARILAWGMYLGLGILLLTFVLYATGVVAPAVPINDLPRLWTLSAHEYLVAINNEFLHREHLVTGWAWVAVLNKGDYLNFLGIAFLAAVTIGCYGGILPSLVRKKDWTYAAIALAEVIVLALAASGFIAVGGH